MWWSTFELGLAPWFNNSRSNQGWSPTSINAVDPPEESCSLMREASWKGKSKFKLSSGTFGSAPRFSITWGKQGLVCVRQVRSLCSLRSSDWMMWSNVLYYIVICCLFDCYCRFVLLYALIDQSKVVRGLPQPFGKRWLRRCLHSEALFCLCPIECWCWHLRWRASWADRSLPVDCVCVNRFKNVSFQLIRTSPSANLVSSQVNGLHPFLFNPSLDWLEFRENAVYKKKT